MHSLRQVILLLALGPGLSAQFEARLLRDLDPTPSTAVLSSYPDDFTRLGAWTFFTADDGVHGRELFRTAGTPATTGLFADLSPGLASSSPIGLIPVGSQLFFFADDGVHGREPWVSDGTPQGTRMILEMTLGTGNTVLFGTRGRVGEHFLFTALELSRSRLMSTDGTASGTVTLFEEPSIGSASPSLSVWPSALVDRGATQPPLLFMTVGRSSGLSWWCTDGTPTGTTLLRDFEEGPSMKLSGTSNGLAILLEARVDARGTHAAAEFWRSDGTPAGTIRYHTMPQIGIPRMTASFDGRVWFTSFFSQGLLVTDGTALGTRTFTAAQLGSTSLPWKFEGTVNGVLRAISVPTPGQVELFHIDRGASPPVFDGTLTGVPRFNEFGILLGSRGIYSTIVSGFDPTMIALDFSTGSITDLGVHLANIGGPRVAFGDGFGRVYFPIADPVAGVELGVTDGTPAGSRLVTDVNAQSPANADSFARGYTAFGRQTAFVNSTAQSCELWVSDGTTAGTHAVVQGLSVISNLIAIGERLAFVGTNPNRTTSVFVTDGSLVGTHALPTELVGSDSARVFMVAELGSHLVVFARPDFAGFYSGDPFTVTVTDGTTSQRILTKPFSALLGSAVRVGESLVFLTSHPALTHADPNASIMVTDGTITGTRTLAEMRYSFANFPRQRPNWLVFGDRSFIVGHRADGQQELWVCDGTTAGTHAVAPVAQDIGTDLVAAAAVTRSRILLVAPSGMWTSDGTASGTLRLAALPRIPVESTQLQVLGDLVVFDGQLPGTTRYVPFVTDGTDLGTRPLLTTVDRTSNYWSDYVGDGRHVLFRAYDMTTQDNGTFVTDGTPAGTRRIADIGLAPVQNQQPPPGDHVLSNGLLYLTLYDEHAGSEPHVIDVGGSVQRLSEGCGGAMRRADLFATFPVSPSGGLDIRGRASGGTTALVLLSAPPLRPSLFPAAGACTLEIDPSEFVVLATLPINGGGFAARFPLANDPYLYGLQAVLQAVVAPTDGTLGVDFSNGLLLTIGS